MHPRLRGHRREPRVVRIANVRYKNAPDRELRTHLQVSLSNVRGNLWHVNELYCMRIKCKSIRDRTSKEMKHVSIFILL